MYSKLAVVATVLLVAVAGVAAEEYNCMAEGRVCQNGGVCHENALNSPAVGGGNGWTTPFCVCQAPWGGPDCSWKIRECKDSPCQNGGTCSPASCTAGTNSQNFDCFTCSCPRGWTGAPSYGGGGGLCDWKQVVQDCSNNVCANGGTCTNMALVGNTYGYECECTADWFGGETGQSANRAWNCTVPTCSNTAGACLNSGTCSGSGTCSCPNSFWGDRCEIAGFCSSNPCPAGNTCTDTGNGMGTCSPPPFCSSNPCPAGATCSDVTSTCSCVAPTDGTLSCNGTLFCNSSPCQNGGNCTNNAGASPQGGAGTCTCPKGFIGAFCEEQIKGCGFNIGDQLLGRPLGCAPNSANPGGSQINNCACYDQASCDASFFNTRCSCPASTGGLTYYDCRCNSTTTSKCPGNTGSPFTGRNSDLVCQNGGTCAETFEATACNCRPGFWGDKCQNYDNPCLNNPCENNGQCFMTSETKGWPLDDRFWAYRCNCKWPYYGKHCERVAPVPGADGLDTVVCGATTCLNGGTCSKNSYSTSTGGFFYSNPWTGTSQEAEPWTCTCALGFGGAQCEITLERCAANTCQNGGHCRNVQSVGVQCSCPCGFAGDRCEIPATNAAATSLAQFTADGSGGVGYMLEFCSREPCQNGGTCFHSRNGQSFTCMCTSGWSGTYCQNRVRSAATGVVPSLIAVAAAVAVAFALKH